MWPRAFRVGRWIAAALATPVALFALFWIVVGAIRHSQGGRSVAGSEVGLATVILSLAMLLATPLCIGLAVRRWGNVVAACVLAAIVIFGTFMIGFALIVMNVY